MSYVLMIKIVLYNLIDKYESAITNCIGTVQ